MIWAAILVTVLVGYFLGNHNGSVVTSRLVANDDVRSHGSGNAGLTNFIRNYGVGSALYVIAIDGGKAVLACLAGDMLLSAYGLGLEGRVLGGAAAMLGHVFPVLLGFKGGKGILSGLLIALMMDWRIAVLILAVFFLVYLLTRYVSLSSILAAAAFGVGFVVFHYDNLVVMISGVFMAALAIFMHRSNIGRLLKGQESKTNLFGKGKQK